MGRLLRSGDLHALYHTGFRAVEGRSHGSVEVAVPGGEVKGMRQSFSGAPVLTAGGEYVLLLWTAHGAPTQVIGLTQGLFSLPPTAVPTRLRRAPRLAK